MRSLVIVQHCQSEHHINGMTGGWTDTPLTELGRCQAEAIGRRLGRELGAVPCRIYTSDLLRARQTADIIGTHLKRSVVPVRELRECNGGDATGKTAQWARENQAPGDAASWDWRAFAHAETWREFSARVWAGMERLEREHPAEELPIVVTHGGTLVHIVCWWMRLGGELFADKTPFHAAPASLSVLATNRHGKRELVRLNDTAHLYAEGIAGWAKVG